MANRLLILAFCAAAVVFAGLLPAAGQQPAAGNVLHIGTSGDLAGKNKNQNEKGALDTLRDYIRDETGLNNEIARQKDWRELTDRMKKGELQLGVFQGYEFAWAREQAPNLKPLGLAVNVYTYPVVYVIVRQDNAAKDFAALAGQSLGLLESGATLLRFYVSRQCQANGKTLETFFSKVTPRDNIEDALDDVVDGVVQVTVADRAGLEAFRRRKPFRFARLRPAVQSEPFPPPVVAYYDDTLDAGTRQRYLQALLDAKNKERGRTILTMFKLTEFQTVPDDFQQVLARTRQAYPPEGAGKAGPADAAGGQAAPRGGR